MRLQLIKLEQHIRDAILQQCVWKGLKVQHTLQSSVVRYRSTINASDFIKIFFQYTLVACFDFRQRNSRGDLCFQIYKSLCQISYEGVGQ